MSEVSQETMMFKCQPEKLDVAETIKEVYAALEKKGYNPVDQLAGYLLSGDPTYITSYDNARTKLRRHERYELIEAMVINYLQQIKK
ncbi:IreB family regulatory phosphoprotein [uncultured Phascolarctobacterium sp.]|uniref:IreB family regulatory phosphoprotein n=1 Tax=uncultured Phascolarctobacterium sp. TaxID=512296 RepID=UPI00261D16F0|nr:IreB family regulatory phosphoprotein [uncultured Phascolarctobacterium sp.]